MNLKKIAAALSMAGATVFSGAAFADPSITNLDGTTTPFGGFDWASGSAAWTTGFTGVPGSNFTLTFAGWAGGVDNTTGGYLSLLQFDPTANGVADSLGQQFVPGKGSYMYTTIATFNETIQSCNVTFTACTFVENGGAFSIYYDTTASANASTSAWTGLGAGTKILGGTVDAGSLTNFDNALGGQANLKGLVNYTNTTYVNPTMTNTIVTSTLQLKGSQTSFLAPTSVNGVGIGAGEIVLQADANQTFSAKVPEPASLALVGLALGGLGFVARRRK